MYLTFDSIEEFNAMADAMGFVKRATMATVTMGDLSVSGPAEMVLQGNKPADADEPEVAEDDAGNEPPPEETKPKRTRRTKAQIAADAAAAEQAAISGTTSAGAAGSESQPATQTDNPFAADARNLSAATQAILNAPTGQAATLAGIAAMQVPEAAPVLDAEAFIAARSLELLTGGEPLTVVSHMHKCREFIAAHGQAAYTPTFALAGVPLSVAALKPEQIARHQAALEFSAKS